MDAEIRITGVRQLISKLEAFKQSLSEAMEAATLEAMEYVKSNAQDNLQDYFDQPRKPYEPPVTGALQYDSWVDYVDSIGTRVLGKLLNTHRAAAYIEFGTIAHEVLPSNSPKLIFTDPDTGLRREEDRVFVSGIEETNFLSKAVHVPQSERDIWAIYEKHLLIAMRAIAI